MRHSLRRTSPKGPGQKFIGVCTLCGKENVSLSDMESDDCPNVRGLTEDEAVVEAIQDIKQ